MAQRASAMGQFTVTARPASQVPGGASQGERSRNDAERERALAPVNTSNRARPAGLPASYTVAPRSTFDPAASRQQGQPDHRPIGAGGAEAFRRMTQKGKGVRRG